MRKAMAALAAFGMLATGSLTACTDDGGDSGGNDGGGNTTTTNGGPAKVGVIMPDRDTQRWGTDDPKFLKAAFDAAGVPVDIQNAEGSRERFVALAESMISSGAKVLIIVALDAVSGKAALDRAKAAGVKTIDYDRLTLNGGAEYYVSFDNRQVGVLQGQGLVRCLTEKGYENPVVAQLNGSPTDNNATEFKRGYDSVLQPKYDAAVYRKGPDQSVPDWKDSVGSTIFQQMLNQQPEIEGVLAANDGLGNAVINVLKKKKLNGKVPVTGQDASVQGLQNILAGDQCMTVYKAIKPEAEAAAKLAITLFKGQTPDVKELDRQKDVESGAYVPFVKLNPVAIDKTNINLVIEDGFVDRKAVCTPKFAQACEDAGL
ncbi:sugar ABC transporter substrate-binding protein [Jidongwangia harbinensis]|uniref:sugar ABC transporter substrate-binding protein n=1 Tax=Jidongwangia harbinensis TaxID=2878561 RepID=UPI001CD986AD|nr:substrate-binding domain-containing protein [Jidongwangia harbinensis]MCA2214331.1 substrate-binding domain-containing protein [Jidongwangia harbinensis]